MSHVTCGVSRRRLAAILVSALFLVSSETRFASAQGQQMVFSGTGGAYEDAIRKTIIEPFERQTGIKVVYESTGSLAKTKAQVESGKVVLDVAAQTGLLFTGLESRYLEPIDYSVFDGQTLENLFPEARHEYGVGQYVYSTVMAYSTKAYPPQKARPQNWAEFWNVQSFPGPRTLLSMEWGDPTSLVFALLAAGLPKDKIYPLDVDKAFASLDKIKPHVVKWWSSGAEPGQMLVDGEVPVASAWNGRIDRLKSDGAPVEINWNEGEYTTDYFVVPKGAPNKAAAMRFLAFASTAESQARLNSVLFYGPTNRKALDMMDRAVAERLPTFAPNRAKQVRRDLAWLNARTASGKTNREVIIERWNQWRLK